MRQEYKDLDNRQRSNLFWKRLEDLQDELGVELDHEDSHGAFLLIDQGSQERICYGWVIHSK